MRQDLERHSKELQQQEAADSKLLNHHLQELQQQQQQQHQIQKQIAKQKDNEIADTEQSLKGMGQEQIQAILLLVL